MKKLISILLSIVMAVTCMAVFVACEDVEENIRIGLLMPDPNTEQNQAVRSTLATLEETFNVTFVVSEAITTAEIEQATIENWATAGIKGVINFGDQMSEENKGRLFKENEMYFINYGAPNEGEIAGFGGSDNPYFLGGIGQQNSEVKGAYDMTMAALEGVTGAQKILVATGGNQFGVQMFIDRKTGIDQAIAEWEKTVGNVATVDTLPGFPSSDGFAASAAGKMTSKPDIIIATAAGGFWNGQISAIKGSDATYSPILAMNDTLSMIGMVKGGAAKVLAAFDDDVIVMTFAYLYNFVSADVLGHTAKLDAFRPTTNSGKLVGDVDYTIYTSANADMADTAIAEPLFTIEQVKNVTFRYNSDLTLADFMAAF